MVDAPQRDYYQVLGVPRDADAETIKNAFRELALEYHPDRNKSPGATERFKEIAEAYGILSDPKKRAQYDSGGFAGVADFSPEDLFAGIDFGDIFGDVGLGFDFGGGGLFDSLFRRRSGAGRGRDLEAQVVVPLATIAAGGRETVRYARQVSCASCKGSGAKAGTAPRRCETCDGSGQQVVSRREKGGVQFRQITTCPDCHGQGSIIEEPCLECRGSGRTDKEESLDVSIPAGADEGLALRIPGHGLASAEPRGRPGDLYVIVRSERDARFERLGADLWREERLEVPEAVLGTHRRVPTLSGGVEVKIPAGTQPDEVLRLRGKGLPRFGGTGHGDLNIRIEVHVPEHPGRKERELYRQLQKLAQKRGRK